MKKVFYFAVLVLAAGCVRETPVADNADGDNLVTYSFTASVEGTKAGLSDQGVFSWSEKDELAIWDTVDGKFYTFTSAAGDGTFSASLPDGSHNFTVAFYPASIAKSATTVSLPDSYTLADATSGKAFAMYSYPEGNSLSFKHLGSILRVTVKDVPVNATEIKVSAPAAITGDFTLADEGEYKIIGAGSGSSEITIPVSITAKQDVTFTLPLPTGNYSFTVTLGDGTNEMLTKTASSRDFKRKDLHILPAVTVDYPVAGKQLIGRYSIGGTAYDWTGSETDFTALEGCWGWFKASIEVPDYYVSFKLYKDGVYTGSTLANDRKIVGTIMPVDTDGNGNDISIYTNRTALDVYYSPVSNQLFTLPEGADFVIPTTAAGAEIDQYALIGYHAADSWNADIFQEAVYSFDDWRVVRIGTADGDNTGEHFSIKYRKNGGWTEQLGSIYRYRRAASTLCYVKTSNGVDFDFYPGAGGDYDIYLKSDFSSMFILPAGTAFNVPGRKEQEDLVSILSVIGGLNGHNWDTSYPLTFASSDNHDWYSLKNATKIEGWGAMVFKLWNGGWGDGLNVGWPASLDGAIGDVETVYPLYLRDSNDDIPNIQLNTVGGSASGNVDIYIKADLSEIFTLPAGTSFYIPTPTPTVPPKAVFIGDSITQFWDHAERGHPAFFTSNNYMSKGVEGQTSATIKSRFNWDVISNNPQQVVIQCGANDLAGNGGVYVAPADICQNIADMAAAAKAAGIEVFIGSLLPCNYFWWNPSVNPADNIIVVNGLLQTLCSDNGYTYVNYYDSMVGSDKGLASPYSLDGCHPTQAGYTVMEGIVKPLLGD